MIALCLTSRKVQLKLLADACACRRRARVTLPGPPAGSARVLDTRFRALRQNELLLDCPAGAADRDLVCTAFADVHFEHDGEYYAFRTRALGRVADPDDGNAAWMLPVPLCVERRQQREHCRASLTDLGPVAARFTSVTDPRRTFTAQLTNVSGGGIGGTAPLALAHAIQLGDLYWTTFAFPGEPQPFEFVVRLKHARQVKQTQTVALGCMFCAGEDPTVHRHQLRRIQQFIAPRQHAHASPAGLPDEGGD